MADTTVRIGCQTFTWEMLGDDWLGHPQDLVSAIADAGYSGIEITDTMIGVYKDKPDAFRGLLEDAGLTLVSFAFGSDSGFSEIDAVDGDIETTRRWVDFAAHFPDAMVSLGSATVISPGSKEDKFAAAAEIYNRAWEVGEEAGVSVAIHPSSHENTLLFDRLDYDNIFRRLNPQVGWVPDTGHILRGGQDLPDTLEAYSDRIRYVHLKDVDRHGNWVMLGDGVCDTPTVVNLARKAPNFNGWLVVEEESRTAAQDPAAAVAINCRTLLSMGVV